MNRKNRIELIHLLGEELHDTATTYDRVAKKKEYPPITGYGDITNYETKEAIQRRIKVLREELLQLSKSFD